MHRPHQTAIMSWSRTSLALTLSYVESQRQQSHFLDEQLPARSIALSQSDASSGCCLNTNSSRTYE